MFDISCQVPLALIIESFLIKETYKKYLNDYYMETNVDTIFF